MATFCHLKWWAVGLGWAHKLSLPHKNNSCACQNNPQMLQDVARGDLSHLSWQTVTKYEFMIVHASTSAHPHPRCVVSLWTLCNRSWPKQIQVTALAKRLRCNPWDPFQDFVASLGAISWYFMVFHGILGSIGHNFWKRSLTCTVNGVWFYRMCIMWVNVRRLNVHASLSRGSICNFGINQVHQIQHHDQTCA